MATLYREGPALSFSDIMLVPQYSVIKSRLDTDLTTRLTKTLTLEHPVVATNMSTITEFAMMKTMYETGSCGILHRFLKDWKVAYDTWDQLRAAKVWPTVFSIGVKKEDIEGFEYLAEKHKLPDIFLIDIAHGDTKAVCSMIKRLKLPISCDRHWQPQIAAGNIATAEAAKRLCDLGVDAVRVGIGGGGACSTRTVTGHGMPTLQSIMDVYQVTKDYGVPVWADGGFKTSGDIVKALAFGAEIVTLGTMLAGTSDTPGEVHEKTSGLVKKFYGMASKEAQELHRDGLKSGTAAEGLAMEVPYAGATKDAINSILGGLRSGLTYSGANSLQELRDRASYVVLSNGSRMESKY